jgi:hypothetical protein
MIKLSARMDAWSAFRNSGNFVSGTTDADDSRGSFNPRPIWQSRSKSTLSRRDP